MAAGEKRDDLTIPPKPYWLLPWMARKRTSLYSASLPSMVRTFLAHSWQWTAAL